MLTNFLCKLDAPLGIVSVTVTVRLDVVTWLGLYPACESAQHTDGPIKGSFQSQSTSCVPDQQHTRYLGSSCMAAPGHLSQEAQGWLLCKLWLLSKAVMLH